MSACIREGVMQRSLHVFHYTDLDIVQLCRQDVCSCVALCASSKHRLEVAPHLPIDDCRH